MAEIGSAAFSETELPQHATLVSAPTVESVMNRPRRKSATASDLFYTATRALESLTTFLRSVRSAMSRDLRLCRAATCPRTSPLPHP
jgi:hypothetical protein